MYLFDVHSHILPGIDDGVKTPEESVKILKSAYDDGIRHIVLTPHFGLRECPVEQFLKKRERQFEILNVEIKKSKIDCPKLYLGAEVSMTSDLSEIEDIEKLAIQGTNYILVEMPYADWQEWMYTALFNLMSKKNLVPIMAHIERYMDPRKDNKKILRLSEMDIYFQINAASAIDKAYRKFLIKLACNNLIFFLGSDTHDSDKRPNKIKEAVAHIEKRVSKKYVEFLMTNARMMLENRYIEKSEAQYVTKENMGFLSKIIGGRKF